MKPSPDVNGLRLVTVREAAGRLACSEANVYALIEAGDLAVVQVGLRKGYRIDLRDLEAFIQGRKFCLGTPPKRATKGLKHIRL